MARPRRPQYAAGHYYHIYNRGRSRLSIFHHHDDYLDVLKRMKYHLADLQLSIIAYCLMPNHYHFLVRQNGEHSAGKLPQRIFNGYSKRYNHRYNHSGTIFEGPYDVVLVDTEPYLRHLCRYIHANPVKDRICAKLTDWQYSNYQEWVGLRHGTLVDHEFINDYFETAQKYQAFVDDYLIHRKLIDKLDYLRDF